MSQGPRDEPVIRTPDQRLRVFVSSTLGEEVAGLLGRPRVRLVTPTGPGGVGKTRLAVAVGERLRDRFGAGTAFVPLEAVTDPGQVLAAIGRAAGARLTGTGSPEVLQNRGQASMEADLAPALRPALH